MSGWSRTVKPSADKTIPANEIFGVDKTEIKVTPGLNHIGWVHRREIGENRVVYETLVAMKTPPVEDNADDVFFPEDIIIITQQPVDQTVLSDTETTFTVTATAQEGGTILYAWQVSTDNGETWAPATAGIYSGETTPTLTIADTTALDGVMFKCELVITNKTPVVTTDEVTLTVLVPVITIDTEPVDETVTAPAGTSFSLVASVDPTVDLTYEWLVSSDNGLNFTSLVPDAGVYSGADTDTLTISNSTGLNGYKFACEVSAPNDAQTVSSAIVTLTVA
jgi:hypothetical protein